MSRRTSSRSTLTMMPETRSPSSKFLIVASTAARKSSLEPMSLTAIWVVSGVDTDIEGVTPEVCESLTDGQANTQGAPDHLKDYLSAATRTNARRHRRDTIPQRSRTPRYSPQAASSNSFGTHLVLPIIVLKSSSTMFSPCSAAVSYTHLR